MTELFAALIVLQFVAVVSHDLIDVPGWMHGRQVQEVIGRRRLLIATFVNAIFPGIAAAAALVYWDRGAPRWVSDYWVLYCAITVGSALAMWYWPYLFGASLAKKTELHRMYDGTRHVLPSRGDNPRPNLFHVCMHVLFVVNLGLAVVVWLRAAHHG